GVLASRSYHHVVALYIRILQHSGAYDEWSLSGNERSAQPRPAQRPNARVGAEPAGPRVGTAPAGSRAGTGPHACGLNGLDDSPTATRWCCVRRISMFCATAGDAIMSSPIGFAASRSNCDPALTTITSPSSLG